MHKGKAPRFINNVLLRLLKHFQPYPTQLLSMIKTMASEVYKIVTNLPLMYNQDLIRLKVQLMISGMRRQPKVKTTRYGIRSFGMRPPAYGIVSRMGLYTRRVLPQFLRLLRAWHGIGCKCPICST